MGLLTRSPGRDVGQVWFVVCVRTCVRDVTDETKPAGRHTPPAVAAQRRSSRRCCATARASWSTTALARPRTRLRCAPSSRRRAGRPRPATRSRGASFVGLRGDDTHAGMVDVSRPPTRRGRRRRPRSSHAAPGRDGRGPRDLLQRLRDVRPRAGRRPHHGAGTLDGPAGAAVRRLRPPGRDRAVRGAAALGVTTGIALGSPPVPTTTRRYRRGCAPGPRCRARGCRSRRSLHSGKFGHPADFLTD